MSKSKPLPLACLALAALGACTGNSDRDAILAGHGAVIIDADNKVRLDGTRVPVVLNCGGGQFVRRDATGKFWECAEVPWAVVSGKPDAFSPADHGHAALDKKLGQLENSLKTSQTTLDDDNRDVRFLLAQLTQLKRKVADGESELERTRADLAMIEMRVTGLRKVMQAPQRPAASR